VEAAPRAHEAAVPQHRAIENADTALQAALNHQVTEAPAAVEPTANVAAPVQAEPEHAPAVASAEPAAEPAEALGALPDLPTREQIVAGFEQARAAIDTCAAGKHGIVTVDATIANSGRVAHAQIGGVFVGTPEGSCIARAVRGTRFPAFSQQSLKITYPIAL
jgi:hypothetical protein